MLVDTNILLEVQLNQKRASQTKAILGLLKSGKKRGYVTDTTMDSIALIMEHYGRTPEQIQVFFSALLGVFRTGVLLPLLLRPDCGNVAHAAIRVRL